jgi:ribosome maturation factor RimP
MKHTVLEQKIADIARPIVEDEGFDLICVRIVGEGNSQNVQIMAENPETKKIGLDECARVSKAVAAVLDVEDPINGAYRLEVSSPGIDRPLVREKDFEDYAGFEAKIEINMPNENGQKRFRGRIKGIENSLVSLDTDAGEVEIPFNALAKAKLVLTDELIKATANV